jgi:hypothetical protein
LAFGLVVMVCAFGSAASADCTDAATQAIKQRGLTVRSMGRVQELSQPANSNTTSVRAWVRVAGCEKTGYVVVNMRAGCGVRNFWTWGGCDHAPEVLTALGLPLPSEQR